MNGIGTGRGWRGWVAIGFWAGQAVAGPGAGVWLEDFQSQSSQTNQARSALRFRAPAGVAFTVATAAVPGGSPRRDWAAPHYEHTGTQHYDETNWVTTLYEGGNIRVRAWHWGSSPARFNCMSVAAGDTWAYGCQMIERERRDDATADWVPVLRLYGDGSAEPAPLLEPSVPDVGPSGGPLILGPVFGDATGPVTIRYEPAGDVFRIDYRSYGRLSAWPGHTASLALLGCGPTGVSLRADMALPYEGVGFAAWLSSRLHDTNLPVDSVRWDEPDGGAHTADVDSVWATQADTFAIAVPDAEGTAPAATVAFRDFDLKPANPGLPAWTRFAGLEPGDWSIVEAWGSYLAFHRTAPELRIAPAGMSPVFQSADSGIDWNVLRGGFYQNYACEIYAVCVMRTGAGDRVFLGTTGGIAEIVMQNGLASLVWTWRWTWDPVWRMAVAGDCLLFYVSSYGSQSGWHLLNPTTGTHEFLSWGGSAADFGGRRPVDTLLGPALVDPANPVPQAMSFGLSPDGTASNATPYRGPDGAPLGPYSMYGAQRGDVGALVFDNYVGLLYGWVGGPLGSLNGPWESYTTTFFYSPSNGLIIAGSRDALYSAVLPPLVRIERRDGPPVISWERGVLERAPTMVGPWTSVPAALSPHQAVTGDRTQFFRVRSPDAGE